MHKWLLRAAWATLLAMFLHNLYYWGGVTFIPGVGARLMAQMLKDPGVVGVAFYSQPGREFVKLVGKDGAQAYAQEDLGEDVIKAIDKQMANTPAEVRAHIGALPRLTYYGVPWVLLAALVLYWLRPKPIRSLGAD
jgi:hypothetical protein